MKQAPHPKAEGPLTKRSLALPADANPYCGLGWRMHRHLFDEVDKIADARAEALERLEQEAVREATP
jgi:hypothetical protein